MGTIWPIQRAINDDNRSTLERGTKRKVEDLEDDPFKNDFNQNLNTPKRRKLKSTSRYIFETLFLNGENSDICIIARKKEWHLHKVYLCQSSYFNSMFKGSWKESHQEVITMQIPDDNIDELALDIAFGSLYQDDISIKPTHVTNVLAAATLLGLDGLIQQCADIMIETISSVTVCHYHQSAINYGVQDVAEACFDWLTKNLLTLQSPELLRDISHSLMARFVSSDNLVVIQVEMDIYAMLKKWVFLREMPSWNGENIELNAECEIFFKEKGKLYILFDSTFLEEAEGKIYTDVFSGLRFNHIIADYATCNTLEEDRIIPQVWLYPVYKKQWLQMLRLEQSLETGSPSSIENDVFAKNSLRVGRVLLKDNQYCWRWTGFSYGLDLLISLNNRVLTFKRNVHGQTCAGSVSMLSKRQILYRLTIISLDNDGQTKYQHCTDIQPLILGKDEEKHILTIHKNAVFPLSISAHFLLYTPLKTSEKIFTKIIPKGILGDIDCSQYVAESDSDEDS